MTDTAGHSAQSDIAAAHPPKPHLTLRVGVSGHRPKPNKFPEPQFPRVKRQLAEVFAKVDEALDELKDQFAIDPNDKSKGYFYSTDANNAVPHTVRLVSGLAEGADQMAVEARPRDWELDAIYPFPLASYQIDFLHSAKDGQSDVTESFNTARAKAATVTELPDDLRVAREGLTAERDGQTYWDIRNQGYVRLGKFLLGQIDVLVAVWDGLREDGPGGTAEVVRGALNAGIPVVWISTIDDSVPRMVMDVDDKARPMAPNASALEGSLKTAISTIVSVPEVAAKPGHAKHNPNAKERLDDFFRETWPKSTCWVVYDLFKRSMEGSGLRWVVTAEPRQQAQARLEPFVGDSPMEAGALRDRVRGILAPRYAWADSLAVERSNWYRSAYIVCYLLAALLVAVALVGVFAHDIFHDNGAAMLGGKAALVLVELVLIGYIFGVVRKGRKFRWQERWVEYRALAEMLRSLPFLSYVGEHGYIQRSHDLEPASSAWFLWYLRATIRQLGLPNAQIDGAYQNKVLRAVEKHVIDDQLGYNERTAATLARMHRLLHVVGDRCFLLTGIVLGVFLLVYVIYLLGGLGHGRSIGELIGWDHGRALDLAKVDLCGAHPWFEKVGRLLFLVKSFVTFTAALLPALGAAVFGIRETGDFEGFATRAARTAERLEQIKVDFAKARQKLALESTAATLLATAEVLTEDVGAWQSVYGRKQLNLPA